MPHAPEISLHVAEEATELWQKTEDELAVIGLPPPFWAFAWAGGQALARYLLDHPDSVRGLRVLDFATGSGLVAIAAMKAGADRCRRLRHRRFRGRGRRAQRSRQWRRGDSSSARIWSAATRAGTSSAPAMSAMSGRWPERSSAWLSQLAGARRARADRRSRPRLSAEGRGWRRWRAMRCR